MGIYINRWVHTELHRGWVLSIRQSTEGYQADCVYPDGLGQRVEGIFATLEDAIAAGKATIERDIQAALADALESADLDEGDRQSLLSELLESGQIEPRQVPAMAAV